MARVNLARKAKPNFIQNIYEWFVDFELDRQRFNKRLKHLFKALVLIVISVVLTVAITHKMGILAVGLAAAAMGLALIVLFDNRLFFYLLAFILMGYIILSKGFAYIGFFPIYVSEIGLATATGSMIVLFFVNRRLVDFMKLWRLEFIILFFFLATQVMAAVPYFGIYGINVIRDGMQFLYALYTIAIITMMPRKYILEFMKIYNRCAPFLFIWLPTFFLLGRTVYIPLYFPGSPYPLFTTKGSDIAVHLGGLGAYLLLRLDIFQGKPWSKPLIWLFWGTWTIGFILLAIFGRSAMLAALAAMFIAFIFRPRSGWYRPMLMGIFGVSVLIFTGAYSSVEIDIGSSRKISAEQFMLNITSIMGEGVNSNSNGHLEGTKQWRLNWWTDIVNYTFFGDYFLTGKGYGISLADSDGYQVGDEGELRAPHNGHLTFLARGGVPGFILWIIFSVGVLLFLIRKIYDPRSSERDRMYAIWFLSYLAAFHVIISFDVFMESPMGGVWFWSLIGIAFAYFSKGDDDDLEEAEDRSLSAATTVS